MIEADLAELVDEDSRRAQLRRLEQALEQGRLAATEEAGDQVDGNASADRHGQTVAFAPRRVSAATRSGSSGSSGRLARRSATGHSAPRCGTSAVCPVALCSTGEPPPASLRVSR